MIGMAFCFIVSTSFAGGNPSPLTDEQMQKLALESVIKKFPRAIVEPLQSKNPHLPAWKLDPPLPDWRFYCATLAYTPAAPVRQFIAVDRQGDVVAPFDATKFGDLIAKTDRSKFGGGGYD